VLRREGGLLLSGAVLSLAARNTFMRRTVLLVCFCLSLYACEASTPAPAARPSLRHSALSTDTESMSENRDNPSNRDVLSRLPKIRCIFSDLDGTLCHFDRHTTHHGVTVEVNEAKSSATVRNSEGEERNCRLLPTSTMGSGVISDRTVHLVDQLRSHGVRFVIISGARTTTMFARYPRLPHCDAIACETGVKILYPPSGSPDDNAASESSEAPASAPPLPHSDPYAHRDASGKLLVLDREWSQRFAHVTGPLDSSIAPLERRGTLWDLYRELADLALEPDARGYYGCFRVNCRNDQKRLDLLRPYLEVRACARVGAWVGACVI
jgi:hypothetical protein